MRTCFQAEQRMPMNRTELKRMRKSGRLPANIGGSDSDRTMIHLSTKAFSKWVRNGSGGVLELTIEEHDSIPVLLEAIQRDPVTWEIIHADFVRVKQDEIQQIHMDEF